MLEYSRKHFSELLSAFSGILLFSCLHEFLEANGYYKYASIMILLGSVILIYSKEIYSYFKLRVLSKPVILTVSHSLIFIGTDAYLEKYLALYLLPLFLVGVFLLNYNDEIAQLFFGDK